MSRTLVCHLPLFKSFLAVLSNLVGFLQAREWTHAAPAPCHNLNTAPFRVNDNDAEFVNVDAAAYASSSRLLAVFGFQGGSCVKVHLINPSSVSFGTAVITPRWQYVLAAAPPKASAIPSSLTKP